MRKAILATVAVALILSAPVSAQQEDQKLFQMALAMEREEGNLEEAIRLYRRVVQETDDEALAAKAQLLVGICHEKLGNTEAQKAYELVIERYPHQTAQVAAARSRMVDLMAKMQAEPYLTHLYSKSKDEIYLEAQSLSPDGAKLLGITFSSGQNVAYKDLATGEFVYITNFDWGSDDQGYTYDPIWSPDGTYVAFNYCGFGDGIWELRIADLEGESRTIFRGGSSDEGTIYPCSWFPGGDDILAVRITEANVVQLGVVPVAGGGFRIIHEPGLPADANFIPNARGYFQVDLSPDGKQVVFDRAEGDVKKLYILDIDSKTVRPLFDTPASDSQPLWSPDGRHIAFLSDRAGNKTLWAISMDKEGNPQGLPFLLRESMENAELGNWTVQGIAYVNLLAIRDIYTMAVDPLTGAPTGKPRQLDFRPTGHNSIPVYSPDGKYIAFMEKPQQEPPLRNVHILPVSGGEARSFRVPSKNHWTASQDFTWLPDGSGISFTGETSSETPGMEESARSYGLFQLELATGVWQAREMPGKSWVRTEWRGDGQGFYYTRVTTGRELETFERDLQTGTDRLISNAAGFLLRCSRDYNSFASTRDGKIKIMDAGTGEILKEFDGLGLPPLGRPAWSPDGKHMLSWGSANRSYHVINCADGTSRKYEISEGLPEGKTGGFDWSPLGNQMAFAFKFNQWDTYLISNVLPKDRM